MAALVQEWPYQVAGSWYRSPDIACTTKRATRRLVTYPGDTSVVITMSDCACNERLSLSNIHQRGGGPVPDINAISELRKVWGGCKALKPLTRLEVVSLYTGSKRKQFDAAHRRLRFARILPKHANVSMFLKDDKYPLMEQGPLGLEYPFAAKPARCIQYRSKEYCIELGRYTHPLEEHFYGVVDSTGTVLCAKSRNQRERGEDLVAKARCFSDPVFLLLDHSKFDSHCCKELLEVEHDYYKRFYPGDRKLQWLLQLQLRNRGFTKNGTRYFTPGTRMSGDMNTGLGNSVINWLMITSFAKNVRHALYVDGDDSVLIVDRCDQGKLPPVIEWFARYGMETKCDIAYEIEHCEFCQCRPVELVDGWTMARNPARLLTRSLWTVKELRGSAHKLDYIYSVGMCEIAASQGLPVGQALGVAMVRVGGKKLLADVVCGRDATDVTVEVADITRESYSRAWDLAPTEQLELEWRLGQMVVSDTLACDYARWCQMAC